MRTTLSNGEGSFRPGPSRIFALLEISGDKAFVSASNDQALRGRIISWTHPSGQLPPAVLDALDLSVAVHRPFNTQHKAWELVCGARGNAPIALEELIDDWTLQLVHQIAEQRDQLPQPIAQPSTPSAVSAPSAPKRGLDTDAFVLCFQPIFDVTLHRATRAEALLRYQSAEGGLLLWDEFTRPDEVNKIADADRWVLRQVLDHIGEWTEREGLRTVHVNLAMHGQSTLNDLLGMLHAAAPRVRTAIAVEINGATDYGAPAFVDMVQAFAQAGTSVGIELAGQSALELALLRRLPLSFVKVQTEVSAVELAEVFGWDVFATRVQAQPNWELLRQHGVKFVQGYALAPPLTIADFNQWLKARVTPRSLTLSP